MYAWTYITYRNGKLYTDNGNLWPPTRTVTFTSEADAERYLREFDLRATIR